jgi:hypothetical protein
MRVHLFHEIGGRNHTEINYVALEVLPIDLLFMQFNKSPVLREAFVAGTDGNRRGMEDVSQGALLF